MPVPPIQHPTLTLPLDPIYRTPPKDVLDYLASRGWLCQHDNLWCHNSTELNGEEFQWPEALAYEIFQNFVMLKTASE